MGDPVPGESINFLQLHQSIRELHIHRADIHLLRMVALSPPQTSKLTMDLRNLKLLYDWNGMASKSLPFPFLNTLW